MQLQSSMDSQAGAPFLELRVSQYSGPQFNILKTLVATIQRAPNPPEFAQPRLSRSADCKRSRRNGATSKSVKNRQRVSKSFSTFSRGTIFPAPLGVSRVKARSSPARGYKFRCVCSYMASYYPGILMTGHRGTNTPKFVPPRWGRQRFDPTQTGLCKFGWVWSSLNNSHDWSECVNVIGVISESFVVKGRK